MHKISMTLAPDETYVMIKTKPFEVKGEGSQLKVQVKELVNYFDFESLNKHSRKSERVAAIRNFAQCFLDSLYLEDKQLRFNQRKKLQKLIELLNEDSVLEIDPADEAPPGENLDDSKLSIMSTVDQALRQNDYEKYLDRITTRVQKRVRGFLLRKKFVEMVQSESIKLFKIDFNQDGEDILFMIMRKLSSSECTVYAYNLSVSRFFNPALVGKLPKGRAEEIACINTFQRIIFDTEHDNLYYSDFFLNTNDLDIPFDLCDPVQKCKVERYVATFKNKGKNSFTQRSFALENRYKFSGKKFIVHQEVPINLVVS